MAQFDPVVIPVNADVQELERAFKKVAQTADKTAKSVENSFTNAFKNIGKAGGAAGSAANNAARRMGTNAGQVANAGLRSSQGFFKKAGGMVGGAAGLYFGLMDVQDAMSSLSTAGRHLLTPTTQLKNFAQAAAASSQQVIASLGQIGLAFQGIQGTVGLATSALKGFFDSTVGREIEFRKTVLNIQTTMASLNRVYDKKGNEITAPLEKIRSLEKPVRSAIKNIIKESENISGTTSEEIIQLFQIISTYGGKAKLSIKEAEQLSLKFAAGLGTLGIPGYQATQEIGSILSGQITSDSALATRLNITSEMVNKAAQSQGGVYQLLSEKLATVVAGQEEASKGFDGLVSNILEVKQNIQQALGAPVLDPILVGLNRIFDIATGTKEQFKAAATAVGELVSKVSTNVIGGSFKGLTTVFTKTRENLGKVGTPDAVSNLVRSVEEAGFSLGRSLESVFTKLGEKMGEMLASFGKLVAVIATLRLDKFAASIQTMASATELYLNTIFNLQSWLIRIKAAILEALGPLGQFIQGFKAVDQVLGPVIKGLTSFTLVIVPLIKQLGGMWKALGEITAALGTLGKVAKQAENLGEFAKVAKTMAEATKQAESFSAATAATYKAVSLLAGAGALLGKAFGPLAALFGVVGKAAFGLVKQLFAIQAVTLGIELAVTAGIMIWQKYEDNQRDLAEIATNRAAAEKLLRGEIDKGTDAVARRNREEQIEQSKKRIDELRQGYKELQDLLNEPKKINLFNVQYDAQGRQIGQARFNLIENLSGGNAGDAGDKRLSDAFKRFNPELEKKLKTEYDPAGRSAIVSDYVAKVLGTPEQVKKLGSQIRAEMNRLDADINKILKQNEAETIISNAKDALQKLGQFVKDTTAVAINDWNDAVGALQARLATLAPNSTEYGKIEASLAYAKAQLQEAGKSVADRMLEAKQSAIAIARTLLDGEEQARSIRRETEREVRQSIVAGIDQETAALLEQMEEKKQREEDIQTRIKRTQLEIADIAARMAKNLVEKTLIIKGYWQAITVMINNAANELVKKTEDSVRRMQEQDPGLATRSGFRGLMGNSGDSSGIHFHLQNRNVEQLLKDAVKEALYMFNNQGASSIYLGRSRAWLTPGMRESRLRELLDAERQAHGGTAIDMQGHSGVGLGKRPDGTPFQTANVLRGWSWRDGLGWSGVAEGNTVYGHFPENGFVPVSGPAHSSIPTETLKASYYGKGFFNRKTASGVPYTPDMMGVAHPSYPFGTVLQIEYGGRKVNAVVVDRGPAASTGRKIDLMQAVADALPGFTTRGVDNVKVRVIQRGSGGALTPDKIRQLVAGSEGGSAPVPTTAQIQAGAAAEAATLGLDRENQQLSTQIQNLNRQNALYKRLLDIVKRRSLIKERLTAIQTEDARNTRERQREAQFQQKRTVLAGVEDPATRRNYEVLLNAEQEFYQTYGKQFENVQETVKVLTERLKDPGLSADEKAEIEKALQAARDLVSMYQRMIRDRMLQAVARARADVQKTDAAIQESLNRENVGLKLSEAMNPRTGPEDRAFEDWLRETGLDRNSPQAKTKWENLQLGSYAKARQDLGAAANQAEEESFYQQMRRAGRSERDIAIDRAAVTAAGGMQNWRNKTEEQKQTLKELAEIVHDLNTEVEVGRGLETTRKQLEMDQLRLKELEAIGDEGRAQLALEKEMLALKQQGKSMTEEEQQRFKELERDRLNQERLTRILSTVSNSFEQGISLTFDSLANELDILFGKTREKGQSFWRDMQQAAANFFKSVGDELLRDFSKDTAAWLTKQVKEGGVNLMSWFTGGTQGGEEARPMQQLEPVSALSPSLAFDGNGVQNFLEAFGLGSGDISLESAAVKLNKAADKMLLAQGQDGIRLLAGGGSGGGGGGLLGLLGGLFGGGSTAVADLAAPASTGLLDLAGIFAADGGVMRGGWKPLKAFATGGIVNTPTLGLVGEGKYNEAIVPLPDGKSIPVQLAGGGAGGVQIGSVNISVQNTGETLSVEAQRSIANQARAIAVEEIVRQTRSGGVLRQGGFR